MTMYMCILFDGDPGLVSPVIVGCLFSIAVRGCHVVEASPHGQQEEEHSQED